MVYSSDFYTSRRPAYYKPGSSYSVTTPSRYSVTSSYVPPPVETRRQYEYHTEQRVESSTSGRPGSGYTTEKTIRTSSSTDGRPGGYHSSYSTTTTGRLPGGTPTYRHYSYRV